MGREEGGVPKQALADGGDAAVEDAKGAEALLRPPDAHRRRVRFLLQL